MFKYKGILMDAIPDEGGGGNPDRQLPPPPTEDNELAQLKARLAQQDTQLSQLRQQVQQRPVQPPPQQQQPQQPLSKEDLEKMYWKDPLAFLQGAVGQAVQISSQQQAAQLPLLIEVARDRIRNTDPELFDALKDKIDAMVNEVPDQYKVNPQVWQRAFSQVRGENLDVVMKIRNTNQQPASNDGPALPSTKGVQRSVKALSPDEERIASKLGLTADQYRHGKELYENQDKFWEQVVTFDSNRKRTVDQPQGGAK